MRHNANKHSKRAWAAILLVFTVQTALANPVDPSVVNGQASFATAGNTLTVTNTPGAIINWQGFSIGANEVTRFAQQNASSAVLNRVVSSNPSSILGSLQSNGRVFLVNPSGIVFGPGATVDVAGLVATSLNLSNADFLAGRYNFTDMPGAQSVSNAGSLAAQGDGLHGGQIYLIAPDVENTGIITAPNGEILLAAGHSVDLVNSIEPNLRVSITAPAGDATNIGQLIAESGSLGLFGTVVRNSGTASADSATTQGGKIVFKASQRAEISGTATATGTTGGTVHALGNQVVLDGNASIDASGTNGGGTVLIGGDAHGANPDIPNAKNTHIGGNATIKADATQNGDGGKVVVWSDLQTIFEGFISAVGGAISGDGGWAEVSGKQNLSFLGAVDTTAPNGKTGTLLLDPTNITISAAADGASMVYAAGTFSDAGATPSNLNVTTLQNQLASSNVTVSTSSGLGGAGDIDVSNSVAWAGPNSLTLLAIGNINICPGCSVSGGNADINLIAGWNEIGWSVTPGAGNINFGASSSLATSGNVYFNAGNSVSQSPSGTSVTANILTIGNTNGGSLPGGVSMLGSNMVNILAVQMDSATGALNFSNGKALAIGSGIGINGIFARDNPSPINITTTVGDLTIAQPVLSDVLGGSPITLTAANALAINAAVTSTFNATPAGPVRLVAGSGGVTSTAAGIITAGGLKVVSGGNVVLDVAPNVVTNVAASVSGAASNSFSFKNADALNVGFNIDGLSGISTPGMVALISTGATGALTQSAGATLNCTSAYLEGSKVILNQANPVGVIAGKATGNATGDIFSYTSSNGIMVTTVNGFSGIVTGSPIDAVSVVLNAGSAGITQDPAAPIHAGAGTHGLDLITTGPVFLDSTSNSVGSLKANGVGSLNFYNVGALTIGIGGNGVTTSGGGSISITAGSDLTVKDPVNAGSGAVSLTGSNVYLGLAAPTTVDGGMVDLTATLSSTGTVSQYVGGTVSATSDLFIAADNIDFGGSMTGGSSGAGSFVQVSPYTPGRSIEIAGASSTFGTLSITQTDLAAINSGLTGGGIGFGDASSGAITFKGNYTSPGGMYTNLYGASVSQGAGTVVSGGLHVEAGGAVTLNNTGNQITSLGGVFTSPSSIDVVTNVPSVDLWGTVSAGAFLSVKNAGGNILVDSTTAAPTILLDAANGITLGTTASLTASGVATIVLNAGTGSFVNNSSAGAAALSAPLSRWLVYAASPANVVKGGLISDFRHYNGDYTNYSPASVTEPGNGFIYASAPGVLSVDTTLVSGTASHIYGATPTAQFGYAIGNPTSADNEDLLLIAGTPAFNPTPSSITPAGSYTVTYLSGLTSSAGYTFTPGTGLLYVIDPATLALITASLTGTAGKTYDGTNTAPLAPGNFLLSGFVNGDDAIVTKTNGVYENSNVGSSILVSTTLAATDFSPVGSTNLANYTLPTSASGPIGNITPAPLTVAANPDSKVYDGTAYSGGNGVSYSGLMNGETAAVLGGTLAYGGTSQGAVNAGSYLITPSGLTSSNYTIGYVDGTLTITPAALGLMSVTANDASKTYGDTLTFTGTEFTPVGLLGGDTISGVTLTSPGAVDTANAGIYAITPSNAVFSVGNAGNYTISYVDGQLTVNPAPLTVTADALSKAAGNPDPLLTYTTTGLKLADTTAATLGGELARLAGEAAGVYPINQGTLSLLSSNYTMNYVPADFSIVAPSTVVNELVNDIIVAPPDVPFEPPASPEPAQTPAADADDEEENDEAASVVPDGTPANETATAAAPLPVCK